ncbi:MAG: sugar transferase [Acidimicrobiales bacterium]|nr:sugar transferase [Acidimicrobiales bacterium]
MASPNFTPGTADLAAASGFGASGIETHPTGSKLTDVSADVLADEPVVTISRGPYVRVFKRMLDAFAGLCLAIVLAPVLAAIAVAIRLTLGRGVLFRQDRIGKDGDVFSVYKFRTMRHDRRATAKPFGGPDRRATHKTKSDPRHTRLGRFLRKWSLDELPQLFNVLAGDMSLVGPRPELASVAAEYGLIDHPRTLVRPGITGAWQISPLRTELLHENVEIDLDYVRKVTFLGDVKIMLGTITAVVHGRGA